MTKLLREDYTPVQGNSLGMSPDNPQGPYAQRMYQQPPMTSGPMQGMQPLAPLMEAHDRVALVQERPCAPSRGTERYRAAQASLGEAGRTLSADTHAHLDAAHNALASHLGLECAGMTKAESVQLQNLKEQTADLAAQVAKPRRAQPQHGNYLREQMKSLDWTELADRTAPLPDTLDMQLLLKEFEQLLALQYDDRFKILSFDLV